MREMKNMTVTKIFEIAYAHYLPNYPGDCANLHGHTAKIEVTFERPRYDEDGIPGEYPGMVLDFKVIKREVEPIVKDFDHVSLNSFLRIPTVENLCRKLVCRICRETSIGDYLVRVRIWESSTSYVEWRRETDGNQGE